jgi:hypothetical protein
MNLKISIYYSMLMVMTMITVCFTSVVPIKTAQESSDQKIKNIKIDIINNDAEKFNATQEKKIAKNSVSNDISQGSSKAIPNLFGNMGSSSSSKNKNISKSYSGVAEPCTKDQVSKTNKYKDLLGTGFFGKVFGNKKSQDAMKETVSVVPGTEPENEIKNEIQNGALFQNSDRIINTYEACYIENGERTYYIFMERCSQDFDAWFRENVEEGDVDHVKEIFKEIAEAYIELHSQHVLQLDIHIGNLIMCGDKLKLIDLGKSKRISVMDSNGPDAKLINREFMKLFNLFRQLLNEKKIEGTPLNDFIENTSKQIGENEIPDLNDLIDELTSRVLLIL